MCKEIEKVGENFYRYEKEPQLFFYMERITSKTAPFWHGYGRTQNQYLHKMGWLPRDMDKYIARHYDGGLVGFHIMRNDAYIDAWVAFVGPNKIDSAGKRTLDDIEMAVTIKTHNDAPMNMNMGISRAFYYMTQARIEREQQELTERESTWYFGHEKEEEEDDDFPSAIKFPHYPRISILLLGFSAKVILMRFPDKVWLITIPLDKMRSLMKKNIPDGSIYIGDSAKIFEQGLAQAGQRIPEDDASPIERLTAPGKPVVKLKIHSKANKNVLFEYNKGIITINDQLYRGTSASINFDWFTCRFPYLNHEPFVTIDLQALAMQFLNE